MKKYGTKNLNDMGDPKNWELWDAPENQEVLYQTFPEFTCLCPRSGYPDFARIHLITIPNKKVVELKCLKLWFNSFRNKGISHENATELIADTLMCKLRLKYIFVLMEYAPRGNLTTFPMTERGITQRREVAIIKEKLISKLI